MGVGEKGVYFVVYFVEVVVVDDVLGYVVGIGVVGEFVGGGVCLVGVYGVVVVFDDEDDGKILKGGEIVGFVNGVLVDCVVVYECYGGVFEVFVFYCVGEVGVEGDLFVDDVVVVLVVV